MAEQIERNRIKPNPWNVNAFDPVVYEKLIASIRERGIMEPLKIMADPEKEGHFLLIDGYHRWKGSGEIGIDALPCEIWDISEEEAKIRGLQLNYLRGEPVPRRLASLIHDLEAKQGLEALALQLPWEADELSDVVSLLKLPDGLESQLAKAGAKEQAEAPRPFTIICFEVEEKIAARALDHAKQAIGGNPRKGVCLQRIATIYLQSVGVIDANGAG